MLKDKGIVFNIQRYSLHDGPGIRTVVFLKGCPLRCLWCSNPESQELRTELSYNKSRCIRCFRCMAVCPVGAISAIDDGISIERIKCTKCLKCVEACVSGALKVEGEEKGVDEIVAEVMRDESFYRNSGGGVTLSGGEVLVQYGFAASILKTLKKKGIGTAIETAGCASWEHFREVLDYTDIVLYDLKHVDAAVHKYGTGIDNSLILENLSRIAALDSKLVVRIPLIPGFNMDKDSINKSMAFLKGIKRIEVNILPFHQLGSRKYTFIDKEYQLKGLKISNDEEVEGIRQMFEENGFDVCVGG